MIRRFSLLPDQIYVTFDLTPTRADVYVRSNWPAIRSMWGRSHVRPHGYTLRERSPVGGELGLTT